MEKTKVVGLVYWSTAYRPTYPVYLHVVGMTVYKKITGKLPAMEKTDPYFLSFAAFVLLIGLVFWWYALLAFEYLTRDFLKPSWGLAAMAVFAFFPSMIWYIGAGPYYENWAMAGLVIYAAMVVRLMRMEKPVWTLILKVSFLLAVMALFRPQLMIIMTSAFAFMAVCLLWLKNRKSARLVFQSAFLFLFVVALFNLPVLIKNNATVGEYVLSTNAKYDFFFGHNPYTRGSWCGVCEVDKNHPAYLFLRQEIPEYDRLEEVERSNARFQLAGKWIKENPLQEIKLIGKKRMIFWIPTDYGRETYSLLNIIIFGGAVIYCFIFLYRLWKKKLSDTEVVCMSVLVGVLVMSVVFFTGHRWRLYAEPFIIIFATYIFSQIGVKIMKIPGTK